MKKKYLASLVLSVSMITALFANVTSAEENNTAHALPIKSEMPSDQATVVDPTAPISITLDPDSPNFKRFRQQFINGSYTITINNEKFQSTYNHTNYTITVPHPTLSRHTRYTVTLLVKAMANGNTASGNASDSFTFETGSAVGEATHVTATVANPAVSVEDEGTLIVTATDDFGHPATDATVTVTGTGGFITPVAVPITNGTASVPLKDHTAESVTLTYTVQDNTYNDVTHSGTVSETFTPGVPDAAASTFTFPSGVAAGSDFTVSGTTRDQYGNLVPGQSVTLSFDKKSVNGITDANGNVSLTVQPTAATAGSIATITAGSAALAAQTSAVYAAAPEQLLLNLPASLLINPTTSVDPFFQPGSYSFSGGNLAGGNYSITPSPNPVQVSGSVADRYGNVISGAAIDYTGALSGNLTSGVDGTYSGQLTSNSNGALSASVNGVPVSITSGNGQTITSVSSSAVSLHYQTGWLYGQVQSGVSQTFSGTAAETKTMTFNWAINGFVGWFNTHQRLQMYVTQSDGSKQWHTLSDGSGGWGGYSANGTFTVNVTQGKEYGFVIYGRAFQNNDYFAGTLTLSPSN